MTSQQIGNIEDLYDDLCNLIDKQQSYINKQTEVIELHKKIEVELRRRISLLEEEILLLKNTPKGCSTCKHVYCRGDREPCRSCNRCITNTNSCTTKVLSDKWEPKVCDETIKELQSEIDASRKDDSHIKA